MVIGTDACGTVESVGPSVTAFRAGDRVCGFGLSMVSNNIDEGALQTYTILRSRATAKIPQNMSFEEGATLPMGVATASSGMYSAGMTLPTEGKSYEGQAIVVWGAASSVGCMAVQIAREMGFTVFGTASAHQHECVKSLGATAVVDYKDPEVVKKIVDAATKEGMPITHGYDAVCVGDSPIHVSEIIHQSNGGKGGKLVHTGPLPQGKKLAEGVEVTQALAFKIFTDHEEVGRAMFTEYLTKALESGVIKPAPKVEIVEGGLEATQKAWDQLKKGVSGRKLVIKVE